MFSIVWNSSTEIALFSSSGMIFAKFGSVEFGLFLSKFHPLPVSLMSSTFLCLFSCSLRIAAHVLLCSLSFEHFD